MKLERVQALDRRVALLLSVGTWLASTVIALGLAVPGGSQIVTAGIALLVALPILRIGLVLTHSLLTKDSRIATICAAVLLIIALGVVLGVHTHPAGG